jgi:hypothetical protein
MLGLCLCQKKIDEDKRFAKIGSNVYSREDFDAFMRMQRLYPSALSPLFPGDRATATFFVETEVLYKKARWQCGRVKRSDDWKWKKRYFPAQMYIQQVIAENMGFSDQQIEEYYNTHLDSFKVVQTIKHDHDSASADSAHAEKKDSVSYRPLAEVRERITKKLFCEAYPPDSAFYAETVDSGAEVDTEMVMFRWVQRWRRDLPSFFMKVEYEAQIGTTLPDSLAEWYGKGKVITPADMDVIMGWLSEDRRESYKTDAGQKYLAEWLLKWKLFDARAKKTRFNRKAEVKAVLGWAWKLEAVTAYIKRSLAPKARRGIEIDTAMCVYAFWDKRGTPGETPDSAGLAGTVKEYYDERTKIGLDKIISGIRKRARVEFLQADWKDDKGEDRTAMMAEAESLLVANESRKAESKYRDVFKNFPYTEEGMTALTEMAKIQTEKGSYRDAINNYRKYLILAGDVERRCNTFFMIGFIYDEYLNKSRHAEVHYKWILKNTPECELADDAEFMCLHLDEPMTSVEELQTEARRQGRTIEDSEPITEEVVDTVAANAEHQEKS